MSDTEFEPSRVPLFVPAMPIWPTKHGSAMIAHAVHSPLLRRCGPQPCTTYRGFVSAISRASSSIFFSGIPVIFAAHAGVFSTLS